MGKPYEELYLFAKHLAKETEIAPLMSIALQGGAGLLGASQACIVLFDANGIPTQTALWGITLTGEADREAWELWIHGGIIGLVYHTQRMVHLPNIQVDPRWGTIDVPHLLPKVGAALGIPLIQHDQTVAVILFLHGVAGYFDSKSLPVAEEIATLCAGHIAKAQMYHHIASADVDSHIRHAKLQRDLSAMIYHDLRVPLQTLRASSGKLAELLVNHPDTHVLSLLQVNIRSMRQLRRLVDNLLDMERLENGDTFIQRKPTNLHDLISDAVELVQPLAVEGNQHFRFSIPDDLPYLVIDSDMILRVLVNLLENALKYTPEGGVIIIGITVKEDKVWFNVQDSGEGIPKHLQEKIFEKFSRAHRQALYKSIGLGLTFCRLAVEAHEGKIWVESEVGEGTNFIFTLPLSPTSSTDNKSTQEVASTA